STLKSKNVGFNPTRDNKNHTIKPSSSKDVSNIEVNMPTETSQAFNSENDQDLKLPEVE
ncbi:13723_t:CDS:1, partial [Gigaspora rosea]